MALQNSEQREVSAQEWRQLRQALSDRMKAFREAQDRSRDILEQAQLHKKIDEVKEQIRTLLLEETVAQFVEDAEQYVIRASGADLDLDRDPDEEPA